LGGLRGVTAMTDVTGFGLLGHLIEMAEGSGLTAEIYYDKIPLIEGVREYISQRISPDATFRNWNSYNNRVKFEHGVNVIEAFIILPDPQTNGGLLFSVDEKSIPQVSKILREAGLSQFSEPIGKMISENEKTVYVLP
jgi:selenide, water dikinase